MRHPRIIIASVSLAAATGQGVQGFFVATPGLTPVTGSSASAGTAPAASSGTGYGY